MRQKKLNMILSLCVFQEELYCGGERKWQKVIVFSSLMLRRRTDGFFFFFETEEVYIFSLRAIYSIDVQCCIKDR